MKRIKFVNKASCTGCAACSAVCPKQCIKMQEDDEGGFIYPVIEEPNCVNCGFCAKVCQAIKFDNFFKNEIKAYIGTASEENVKRSASGGASAEISSSFISQGGIVYGCVFTSDLKVVHQRAETLAEVENFRKSKYIQSYIEPMYRLIEKDLKAELPVLFTGTSCQCAAIYKYLKGKHINTEKLYTINLLCHGVPSQHLFDVYKQELENKLGKKIVSYTFRNKKPNNGSLNSRSAEIVYDNGETHIVGIEQDPFLKMYYSKLAYRPSCMNCQYACTERISDITVADAWKIEQIKNYLNPLKGVSLILVNTTKGLELLNSIKTSFNLESISVEWALNSQKLFRKPTMAHKNRQVFFELMLKKGFIHSVWKSTKVSHIVRIKILIKKTIEKIINN